MEDLVFNETSLRELCDRLAPMDHSNEEFRREIFDWIAQVGEKWFAMPTLANNYNPPDTEMSKMVSNLMKKQMEMQPKLYRKKNPKFG